MANVSSERGYQVVAAEQLGREAHAAGINSAPALDQRVIAMLAGRKVGETPDGSATTAEILKAWSAGWHWANLEAGAA